jgi:hypothetical protein
MSISTRVIWKLVIKIKLYNWANTTMVSTNKRKEKDVMKLLVSDY